jgi:exodeoxyribonuclease VII large subunit
VPVVSAVGHEVDVSVADLVADVRAATPTHAAQLVAPVKEELEERLAALRARLRRAAGEAVATRRRELRALRAELADPQHLVSGQRHRVEDLLRRAEATARGRVRAGRARVGAARGGLARAEPRARLRALVRRAEEATRRLGRWQATHFPRERLRLERLGARLEPANVARLLERGFALVLSRGHVVTRSAMVDPGTALRVALARGWLDVTVEARDEGQDPLPRRAAGRRTGRCLNGFPGSAR